MMQKSSLANKILIIYLVLGLMFVFTPIIMVIIFSFNKDRFTSLPWQGFTLNWYENILRQPDIIVSLGNSIVIAIGVSLGAVILGFMGAYGLRHWKSKFKDLYLLGMISPLAVPWMLLGLGLLILFSRIGIRQSLLTIWISHLVFSAPLALAIINTRLNTIPKSLEEAAWDLGAGHVNTMIKVVLPQALPGIIAAMLLTFTLSFDEFIIAWFVGGFSITLPVYIYGQIRSGINPSINAIGAIVFTFSIGLTVASQYLIRNKKY